MHGRHDRVRIAPNSIGIEIEAALAFGTGHHGTTRGCLLLLDQVLKSRSPRRVLDLGSGTGVLAIAAAKAQRRRVLASDIGANREALGDCGLTFRSRDPRHLRERLEYLLQHPEIAQAHGDKGPERMRRLYSWELRLYVLYGQPL